MSQVQADSGVNSDGSSQIPQIQTRNLWLQVDQNVTYIVVQQLEEKIIEGLSIAVVTLKEHFGV